MILDSDIDDTNKFSNDINDTNEFGDDIDDNIDSKRQEKWVENSATSALAVTRDHPDIRIVMKFPRIRISGYYPQILSG